MHHIIFFHGCTPGRVGSFLLFLQRRLLRISDDIINARTRRLSSISFHACLTLAGKLFLPIRFSGLDFFEGLLFVGFVLIGEILSVCDIISMVGNSTEEETGERREGILRSDSFSARWIEDIENAADGATRDEALNVVGREVVKGRIVWRR
jgi:hypothetical protein